MHLGSSNLREMSRRLTWPCTLDTGVKVRSTQDVFENSCEVIRPTRVGAELEEMEVEVIGWMRLVGSR